MNMPLVILINVHFKDVEKGEKIDEPSTSSKANVPRKKKIKEVCHCPNVFIVPNRRSSYLVHTKVIY